MSEKPLIIFHINTEKTFRGGEIQTIHLTQGLQKLGHQNFLIARPGSRILQEAQAANIQTLTLNMRGEWDFIAAGRLRKWIDEYHPEILHAHTAHACAIALLARRGRKSPRIVYSRRVTYGGRYIRQKLKHVDVVLAVSKSIRKQLLSAGVPDEKVIVVESGTDFYVFDTAPERAAVRKELEIPESGFVIGNVSYFKPEKGQEQLIQAFCDYANPQSYLLLVGEGPTQKRCEEIARESPCAGRILFTGFRSDAYKFYAAMDAFFFSSFSGEGWSGVLREAMGAGVPVIAVRQAATEEQVLSGIVVSVDQKEWIDAMRKLFENPELRKELAEHARQNARRFTVESMVRKTEECYYRLAR